MTKALYCLKLLVLMLVACGSVAAQSEFSEPYRVSAHAGVGGYAPGPMLLINVDITKNTPEALIGRIRIEEHERFSFGEAGTVGQVTVPVTMDEGAGLRTFSVLVPNSRHSGSLAVYLDQQVSQGNYAQITAGGVTGLDGFRPGGDGVSLLVGRVQAEAMAASAGGSFVQLGVDQVPEAWQAMFGFGMVIINDDRLNPAQIRALREYAAVGGTLVISPSDATSFNPRNLAAITGASPTQQPVTRRLSELTSLHDVLPAGMAQRFASTQPNATVTLWPDTGSMRALPESQGLISHRLYGAGNVLLLHVNLSELPFALDDKPTEALGALLEVLRTSRPGVGTEAPQTLLGDTGLRRELDIAGRRVPRPEIILITLLLYVLVAGVGVFALARRIKRPELYPGVLIVCAALSMGLVFSIGALVKRSGARVTMVRMVVSDSDSGVELHSSIACNYVVAKEDPEFEYSKDAMLLPAMFGSQSRSLMGVPTDFPEYAAEYGPDTHTLRVKGLRRWQNVYHSHNSVRESDQLQPVVEALDGAWRVTNRSRQDLRACLVAVWDEGAGNFGEYLWFYIPRLAAGESQPLRRTEAIHSINEQYVQRVRADVGSPHFERLMAALAIPYRAEILMSRAMEPAYFEGRLVRSGLLLPGGSLVLAVGESNEAALTANGVKPSQVSETVILATRGTP
jgi:hypothetical protein